MNLERPSLFAGLLASSIGLGLFVYARKQRRGSALLAAVLLMALPFLTGSAWMILGGTALLLVGLRWAARRGW
ncbi:MAG: hypothetical protein Fur0037_21340 [Planctomycetota bacterium]